MSVITLKVRTEDETKFHSKAVNVDLSNFHAKGSSKGRTWNVPRLPHEEGEAVLYEEDELNLVYLDATGSHSIEIKGAEARRVCDELDKAGVHVKGCTNVK